ncbi:MAG: ArsR family transcriptional regulator [Chloroflexi bacterium B3_Chlor]|nr:MAG: ArsR family transcriptional regulator [Chloroflexi bacterium B3_Chlor]
MPRYRQRTHDIRSFILQNVDDHAKDITAFTAESFGISRPAVLRHVRNLIDDGLLLVHGKTRDRHYALKTLAELELQLEITPDLAEDTIWRQRIRPLLEGVPANVLTICEYGFTEMLSNVVDHSEGDTAIVTMTRSAARMRIAVLDDGIGIFRKIQTELGLDDQRHAILELSKGKLTTDPQQHTGEGIFFTSRAFDHFQILSGDLFFAHDTLGDDWLLETEDTGPGTYVILKIDPRSDRRLQEVFDRYAAEADDFGFTRTRVPVTLVRYGQENLVSRSQAKRLLARFERFREVILDFKGVDTIGQAFADEIFRVYPQKHPEVHLVPLNVKEQVANMIGRVADTMDSSVLPGPAK